MKKKKIALYSIGSVVMVALCIVATMYSYNVKKQSAQEQKARLEAIAAQGVQAQAEAEKQRTAEIEKKAKEIIANGISKEEALRRQQAENKAKSEDQRETEIKDTVTQNTDGTTVTDGEYVKPTQPKEKPTEKPVIPEDQKTNPNKPPEYKPEDTKPKPQPTGGEKNDKGETYVPGFGWMAIERSTIVSDIANNAGTGEIIGH